MMRIAPFAGFAAASFAAVMALFAWLALHGFVGAETVELSGRSIAMRDGVLSVREIALLFPPLPSFASFVAHVLGGGSTAPAPSLVASVTVAGLAALWLRSFVTAGYDWVTSIFMAGALAFGPAFLALSSEGPSAPFLALGGWLMATTGFRLRSRANIIDLMGFSVCLAMIALAHPLGVFVVIGFAPFLIFALPPQVTAESTIGAYLAVMFPFLLVMGGAIYVSWIFTSDILGLFHILAARSGDLGFEALSEGGLSLARSGLARSVPLCIALVLLNAPILIGGALLTRQRLPRVMPMLALGASIPVAGLLAALFGFETPILLFVAPLTGFAAATAAVLPVEDQRPVLAPMMIALGVLGGAASLLIAPDMETGRWTAAMMGETVEMTSASDRALGAALKGRNDVLIDATSAPGVLAGRASTRGLVLPLSASFELTRMAKRSTARYLAVRNADAFRRENDAVHAIFPDLYQKGMPGYVRVYDRLGWRVYERAQYAGG